MAFSVYIVSCSDGSLYVGYTTNIERRLHQHNHLKSGAHYTKQGRPVCLVYRKTYRTLGKALREEYKIKQLTREKKLELIEF